MATLKSFFVLAVFLFLPVEVIAFPNLREANRAPEEDRCILCHGNKEPASFSGPPHPPKLAETFSADWKMFEFQSAQRPPFEKIPEPNSFLPGHTYYDWSISSMTEIYPKKCIDIFPSGRDYPCQFLSRKDKTYFMTFRAGITHKPDSCCLWRKTEFWAPRPDVLSTMNADQSMTFSGRPTDWWMLDIPLPGPFGYGLFHKSVEPAAFWFPVISGWVQQNFYNFQNRKPDPKHFEVPEMCREDIPVCPEA